MDNNNKNEVKKAFSARPYQLKLVDKSKKKNLIVCLQTGSGKTYIAVMLIKELADSILIPYDQGGKRTVFLVNTVPLVQQQADVIRHHLGVNVGDYFGEKKISNKIIDSWDKKMWENELNTKQVLVMSAQILVEMLNHNYISFDRINLIIFDEAHHARGSHPFNQIMDIYKEKFKGNSKLNAPRILGLTASIVNSKIKIDKFYKYLNELEANLCCRVVTASIMYDNGDGTKYAFKPDIKVYTYEKQFENDFILLKKIEQIKEQFKELEDVFKARIESNAQNDAMFLIEKNPFKDCKKYFSDLACILEELGYYAFYSSYKKIKDKILRVFSEFHNSSIKDINSLVTSIFEYMAEFCNKIVDEESLMNNKENIIKYSSPKVQCFLNILKEKHQANAGGVESNNSKFHAIAFVERKETALGFRDLLKKIAELDEWKFIRCEYIIGHSNLKHGEKMDCKQQKIILEKFRKTDINLLIGTSIIEEGVDIPACNMVVRFNLPKNFGSYIQSKGRARAANSTYYLLVDKAQYALTFKEELNTFRGIEQLIENEFSSKSKKNNGKPAAAAGGGSGDDLLESSTDSLETDKEVDDDDEDEEDEESFDFTELINKMGNKLASYKKKESQITCHTAINLINRYCNHLEYDGGMKLYAKWKMFNVGTKENPQFQCQLILPPNAVVHEIVMSEDMPRKKLAKMSAALKMCKLLDEAGELDDNLIPISREQWSKPHLEFDVEKEDEEHTNAGGKHKIGTSKNKQNYDKTYYDDFCDNHPRADIDSYVNLFEFIDCNDEKSVKTDHITFGFVSKKMMPNVPQFNLKQRLANIKVTFRQVRIENRESVRLDERELEALQSLHEHLFKSILNFNNNFDIDFKTSSYGGLIVLLKKLNGDSYAFDWNEMRRITENINQTAYESIKIKNQQLDDIINQIGLIGNATHRRLFVVEGIINEMSPLSAFPNQKYKNYKEYHEVANKTETLYDDQPLIEIKFIDTNLNHIQTNIKKFKGVTKIRLLYIAEHLKLLSLDRNAYNELRFIPASLYRINALLKIAKLKATIESDVYFTELSKRIRQQKFEELNWMKSIKYHKVKEEESDSKNKNDPLLMDVDGGELIEEEEKEVSVPVDVEEKVNDMIIEVCSQVDKYETSGSSETDDEDDELSSVEIEHETAESDGDEELVVLNKKEEKEETETEREIARMASELKIEETTVQVPKFLIVEDQVTLTKIPSNLDNDAQPQEFPNVYELLQCLTLKSANDSFDLERYEILGDCFLKLNTSMYIYCQFKSTSEGNLTYLKSQRVSNRFLYKLAKEKKLYDYIIADGFRVYDNWLPPNSNIKQNLEDGTDTPSDSPLKFFTKQCISDKSLADCVEALLGVYLIKCGTGAARALLNCLGFIISAQFKTDFTKLIELPSPLISEAMNFDRASIQNKYARFEQNIGYKFNDIVYLMQAFTHPSYMSNRYTGSYQRLEFIGDAVLDLLVTQYLFNDEKEHSPGELTDLRQSLVNNKFFAHLSTKHNFHKYISYESKSMFGEIDAYIRMQKKYTPNNAYFGTHDDNDEDNITIDDCDTPKFLADVFESVAGAIFLDSGCSMSTVWNVYYKMFEPYFKMFKNNTPKSPIRALMMLKPNAKFEFEKFTDNDDTAAATEYVKVTLKIDNQEFVSKSNTKNKARIKVCKKAIKILHPNENILFF